MSLPSVRILAYVPRYYALGVEELCRLFFGFEEVLPEPEGDFVCQPGLQIKFVDLLNHSPKQSQHSEEQGAIDALLKVKHHTHLLFSRQNSGFTLKDLDSRFFTQLLDYQDLTVIELLHPRSWTASELSTSNANRAIESSTDTPLVE